MKLKCVCGFPLEFDVLTKQLVVVHPCESCLRKAQTSPDESVGAYTTGQYFGVSQVKPQGMPEQAPGMEELTEVTDLIKERREGLDGTDDDMDYRNTD